jgi:hypothetical protein
MSHTPTTRLEAVNLMLEVIGETPVSNLTNVAGPDAIDALRRLDKTLVDVLTEGWEFNTEYEYPLTRDVNGHIYVPTNVLELDWVKTTYGIDPVQRGNRLYDRKNHTYVFDDDLKVTIIVSLNFDELPQSARAYIAIRAARTFQQDKVGSEQMQKFSIRDEAMARTTLVSRHVEQQGLNMVRDTPDFLDYNVTVKR